MSDSHSPEIVQQQQQTLEPQISPPQIPISETLNKPDSPSKFEPDPENQDEEEEQETHEQEISQQTPSISPVTSLRVVPPIADPLSIVADVTLMSPTQTPNTRRATNKKKKAKGRAHILKKKAIEKKVQTLLQNLNPVPFILFKLPNFPKHESVLRKLGLWDFIHVDFDRDLSKDFIAELVANYDPNKRASYVKNGLIRIMVSRADLARALKLPVKKEKVNIGGVESVDLDSEVYSDESLVLIADFVSCSMILHEDTWIMPNEVINWIQVIKDGHPEKVDWAGLMWFMVEKELSQGDQLKDCYYASHLQCLIKFQKGDVFLKGEVVSETVDLDEENKEESEVNEDSVVVETVELDEESKEGESEVNEDSVVVETVELNEESKEEKCEVNCVVKEPNVELTLGQEVEKDENSKDFEMVDVEESKESDNEGLEVKEEEQEQWILQPCGAENGVRFIEDSKEEDEEMEGVGGDEEEEQEVDEEEEGLEVVEEEELEEEQETYHDFPNDDSLDGDNRLTGNLLDTMEANQMAYGSQLHLQDDMEHMAAATPSFFNHTGKRVIQHDDEIPHHSHNKRLRINDSLDHNRPVDIKSCMDQIQLIADQARALYEEKEQAKEQDTMNQQILLEELQKRDEVIEHLQKTRFEENQKKDRENYRLERELYLMGNVLNGYRQTLKKTEKLFTEYRQKAQLYEEPTYKAVGTGGLMLSTSEIAKIRKQQEEEYKANCLIVELKCKEMEEGYVAQFDGVLEKINDLEERLTGLEGDAKELVRSWGEKKIVKIEEEKMAEILEPATDESIRSTGEIEEEKTAEIEEKILDVEEEEMVEIDEKMAEIAEPAKTDEFVRSSGEGEVQEIEEKAAEIVEPATNE